MRYFLTVIVVSMFLYISCGNNSKPIITTEEYIENALENEFVQEGWDLKQNRLELLNAIKNSTFEGLFPEDYEYQKMLEFEDKLFLLPDSKEEYYQLLTSAYIKYLSHLANGKVNPLEMTEDWEYEPKTIQPDTLLVIALKKNRIDSILESYKPKHTIYKNLKKALVKLTQMPEEKFDTIKSREKFKVGLKSKTVALIKERLRYWGDLKKEDTLNNELYNADMKKAVARFQIRHGLEADGLIGPGTLKIINTSKESRKQQIIANLERWRWFPTDLGANFLGVNIPNYMLYVVENNDTVNSHRVVVGQPKRRTPVLSSVADNIVFNPTWTVPPTIIKEDLTPEATKSKNYFYKNKIKIFTMRNKEVPIWQWKPEDADLYKYVQDPGHNNSLGEVKINFNNKHSVYMHDTNHRDYFVYNYRALSSGCVRIEKPLPLVEYLLKNKMKKELNKEYEAYLEKKKTSKKPIPKVEKYIEVPVYSLAEIDTIIQTRKTKAVKIDNDLKIHFQYFTAWYENNELQFRNDIYQYDNELYLRLSNQFTSNVVSTAGVVNE